MSAVPIQDVLLRHQVLIQRLSSAEVAKFKPFLKEIETELRRYEKRVSSEVEVLFKDVIVEVL
jgi:hypothetical protein